MADPGTTEKKPLVACTLTAVRAEAWATEHPEAVRMARASLWDQLYPPQTCSAAAHFFAEESTNPVHRRDHVVASDWLTVHPKEREAVRSAIETARVHTWRAIHGPYALRAAAHRHAHPVYYLRAADGNSGDDLHCKAFTAYSTLANDDGTLQAMTSQISQEYAEAWDFMYGAVGEEATGLDPAADRALEVSSSLMRLGSDTQKVLLQSWLSINTPRYMAARSRRWTRAHKDPVEAILDIEDGLADLMTEDEQKDAEAWKYLEAETILVARREKRRGQYLAMFEASVSDKFDDRRKMMAESYRRMGMDNNNALVLCAEKTRREKILRLGAYAWGEDAQNMCLVEDARKLACRQNFNKAKDFWRNLDQRKRQTHSQVLSHKEISVV